MPQRSRPITAAGRADWQGANRRYLALQLERLRLLLRRHILWLRERWQGDDLAQYRGLVVSDAKADELLAGNAAEWEARFHATDPRATGLGRAIAEQERRLQAWANRMHRAGGPPALITLSRQFGLTPVEQDVLLLCLALELDQSFEGLFAYANDDASRKHATVHLARALLSDPGADANLDTAFHPGGALRRSQLVIVAGSADSAVPFASRPLRIEERIANYLRGSNRPDDRVTELLRPMLPGLLADEHATLAAAAAGWLKGNARHGRPPGINLVGEAGAGMTAVAGAVAESLKLRPAAVDARRISALSPHERSEIVRLIGREVVLLQLMLVMDLREVEGQAPSSGELTDLVERLNAPIVLLSRERWTGTRELLTVRVTRPGTSAQAALWRQGLSVAAPRLKDDVEPLVHQFDFGPGQIADTLRLALQRAALRDARGRSPVSFGDIWVAAREQTGWRLDDLAQRIPVTQTWNDIVLPASLHAQLREIASQVAFRSRVYDTWGFGAGLTRGRGVSALFSGPSGTGKTMAAEILANHLQLDLFRVDLAGVVSKYIGETEKNLRRVFEAAEQAGAILFFDEADALFGKRTEVKDSHDRYANIEVNYLLQWMDRYRGISILCTNKKAAVDRAFLRRLRFLLDFPFPDVDGRRRIWRQVFPPEAAVEGLDFEFLARLEIPGGNIKNIALNAAFLAANEDRAINMTHIARAAGREYQKIEKAIGATEFGRYADLVRT